MASSLQPKTPTYKPVAQKLNQTSTQLGYGSYDQINFVLAFVQSIPYKTDNESTPYQDYPRFPVETLVDDVGDCKSHSILFASLTLSMGYDAVYINPPDHLAVGILGNNLQGTYWSYNNQNYYYCETTGIGFTIGQLPDQFNDQSANVYGIDQNRQFVPDLGSLTSINPMPTIFSGTSTPTPAQTINPNLTTSPSVSGPTVQPALPISLNLIAEAPILFMVMVAAIVICVAVAIKSAKTQKDKLTPAHSAIVEPPSTLETLNAKSNAEKFCIYCGSSNKAYAAYCVKCGKKID